MNSIFETPVEAAAAVPEKKPRKKRVLTAEQKQAFVARMKKSREERKAAKLSTVPKEPVAKTNSVAQPIIKEISEPVAKVATKPQTVATPSFDYTHFNTLTDNIRQLNESIMTMNTKHVSAPIKTIPVVPVAAPPKPIEAPVKKIEPVAATVVPKPVAPAAVSAPAAPCRPAKKKVWNCGRRMYVYV